MCVGEAWQVLRSDGKRGVVCDGARKQVVDMSITGPLPRGTWVLGFLGAAREVLDEREARRIRAGVDKLRAVMAGGGPGEIAGRPAQSEAAPSTLVLQRREIDRAFG